MKELTQKQFARKGGLAKKKKYPKSFSEMGKKSGAIRRAKAIDKKIRNSITTEPLANN